MFSSDKRIREPSRGKNTEDKCMIPRMLNNRYSDDTCAVTVQNAVRKWRMIAYQAENCSNGLMLQFFLSFSVSDSISLTVRADDRGVRGTCMLPRGPVLDREPVERKISNDY